MVHASRPVRHARGARARQATYHAATRLARLVYAVLTSPYGRTFAGLVQELNVSERTLLRYVRACRQGLVDPAGRPLLEVVRHGERALLRRADYAEGIPSTAFKALSLYFALSVLRFLEGTVIEESVADLWEQLRAGLGGADRARLADFEKKFYAIPYAVKDYHAAAERLDVIIQGLVYQYRLWVEYAAQPNRPKVHEFEPYTLVMYRGGLYLIGHSKPARKVLTLAVERIRNVERLAEKFDYPRTYTPEQYTEGAFGIMTGPETEVALRIRDPQTRRYIEARRLHPTQRFADRSDGTAVLTMTVRGTEELKNWILSFGPHLEVLRPRALRDEVREQHAAAAALYG
jgi:proteasome accessory factor B